VAARCAGLHHADLAAGPGAGVLDRLTRSEVLRFGRLEEVQNVLRARCRPQCEEVVIGVGEGPAAADRDEPRISNLRKDHRSHGGGRPLPAIRWLTYALGACQPFGVCGGALPDDRRDMRLRVANTSPANRITVASRLSG
jgi:hypothetical protein